MRRFLPKSIAPTFWLLLACFLFIFLGGCENGKPVLVLGGGRSGGTFQNFAVELGKLLNQEMPELQIKVKQTAGSVDNLTRVDQGKVGISILSSKVSRRHGVGWCGNIGCSGVERDANDRDAKWGEEHVIVR